MLGVMSIPGPVAMLSIIESSCAHALTGLCSFVGFLYHLAGVSNSLKQCWRLLPQSQWGLFPQVSCHRLSYVVSCTFTVVTGWVQMLRIIKPVTRC